MKTKGLFRCLTISNRQYLFRVLVGVLMLVPGKLAAQTTQSAEKEPFTIVAIACSGEGEDACVNRMFGRAPHFVLYDVKQDSSLVLINQYVAASSKAGVSAAQDLIDRKVDAVIAFECGNKVRSVLKAAGVKVYEIEKESLVSNVITVLKQGAFR